jgi:hypothetical protein
METSPIKGKIVSSKLDKILISASMPNFGKRLDELHHKLLSEARFGGFDKESEDNRQTVLDIVRDRKSVV